LGATRDETKFMDGRADEVEDANNIGGLNVVVAGFPLHPPVFNFLGRADTPYSRSPAINTAIMGMIVKKGALTNSFTSHCHNTSITNHPWRMMLWYVYRESGS
jgi:hypothetical protein